MSTTETSSATPNYALNWLMLLGSVITVLGIVGVIVLGNAETIETAGLWSLITGPALVVGPVFLCGYLVAKAVISRIEHH